MLDHGIIGWIFRFVWRLLFGQPKPKAPKPPRCAHRHQYADRDCTALADPRCLGGNCTEHCRDFCGDRGMKRYCAQYVPPPVPSVTWTIPKAKGMN